MALSSLPMAKQRAAPVINHAVSRGLLRRLGTVLPVCVSASGECALRAECLFVQDFIRQSAHSAHCHIDLATRGHTHTLTPPTHTRLLTHTHTLVSLFSSFGNKSCRSAVKASLFYHHVQMCWKNCFRIICSILHLDLWRCNLLFCLHFSSVCFSKKSSRNEVGMFDFLNLLFLFCYCTFVFTA